jgi:membrane-bound metal-dependent hydrolase YbcI (DUF457 family)
LFVFLAVAPDFDYFALWIFGIHYYPRFTHSLLSCVSIAVATYVLLRVLKPYSRAGIGLTGLIAAACSHPLLDLLVGVHPVPVLWPFAKRELWSPFGLLPSAGGLDPRNFYLWRNLLVELGVLLPFLAGVIALARRVPFRLIAPRVLMLGPLWGAFLVWSIRLH